MPQYIVRFNPDWPNDTLEDILPAHDTETEALHRLIDLLHRHYPDKWLINGATYATMQFVHIDSKAGDPILGKVRGSPTRAERLRQDMNRLQHEINDRRAQHRRLENELADLIGE